MCNVSPEVIIRANEQLNRAASTTSHSVAGGMVVSAHFRGRNYSRSISENSIREYYGHSLRKIL